MREKKFEMVVTGDGKGRIVEVMQQVKQLMLGKDEAGTPITVDNTAVRLLMVAGVTGSGKSQLVEQLLSQATEQRSQKQLGFILFDPKQVGFPAVDSSYIEGAIIRDKLVENLETQLQLIENNASKDFIVVMDAYEDLVVEGSERFFKAVEGYLSQPNVLLILVTSRLEPKLLPPQLQTNTTAAVLLRSHTQHLKNISILEPALELNLEQLQPGEAVYVHNKEAKKFMTL